MWQIKGPLQLPDLNSWMTPIDAEEDSIFDDVIDVYQSPIDGKEGDALYAASHDICIQQMPECSNEIGMLQLMYSQQIRSDCTAYENSLKQQRNASAQKLYTAEQALYSAALEQYQNANKYDLGQCVLEFKQCMIDTGECGDDFSGCATVAAFDAVNVRSSNKDLSNTYKIAGAMTSIEIQKSTYDILYSKKPLCESVTKQCVTANEENGGDQVWLAFLREVAPQVKSAELIATDNARQNCTGNISSCFQTACKDTMDPNDPDGSYDMCLTNPKTMFSLCTVPLNACGITTDPKNDDDIIDPNGIWDLVVARLESMRVNSCTDQVKQCLQSADRCGSDYTQCIGLDTDTIIQMCPEELLVGCRNYRNAETDNLLNSGWGERDQFYANLEPIVQGIFLNIANNLLTECQDAADEAMISVCGSTENCDNMTVNENIGTNTLEYKICEITSGTGTDVSYGNCYTEISQISDEMLGRDTSLAQGSVSNDEDEQAEYTYRNIDESLASAMEVNASGGAKLAIIIEGEIPWNAISFDDETGLIALDESTIAGSEEQIRSIKNELGMLQNNINNAINAIESNQQVQFCTEGRVVQGVNDRGRTQINDESSSTRESAGLGAVTVDRSGQGRFPGLTTQMRAKIAASAIKIATENYNTKYAELENKRMDDYVSLSERIAEIQNQNLDDARRESARLACTGVAESSSMGRSWGKQNTTSSQERDLVGSKVVNNWNYKETVTSTFNWQTMVCHRCTRRQNCTDPKGGRRFCKKWADPVETCEDIQF